MTKKLAVVTGVDTAKYCVLKKYEYDKNPEEHIARVLAVDDGKFPLFVKPSSAGFSVGAHKVKKAEDLRPAIEDVFLYDDKVLVEEMIAGREIEAGLLGTRNRRLLAWRRSCLLTNSTITMRSTTIRNPGHGSSTIFRRNLNQVRNYAVEIFKALDCRGLSRCDFFYSNDGRIVFNEINTLPGFTNISMYPQLWAAMGKPAPQLLEELIQLALEETSVELIKKEHANPQLSDAALRAFI